MKHVSDIQPGLTDSQVLEFCKTGFMILPAVVPEEINRRVINYVNEVAEQRPEYRAPRKSKEIEFHLPLVEEEWFVDHVLLNDQAAAAVRSLLGKDFTLPIIISDHRAETPMPKPGGWHRDGNYVLDKKLNYLEVFCHFLFGTRFIFRRISLHGSINHYSNTKLGNFSQRFGGPFKNLIDFVIEY